MARHERLRLSFSGLRLRHRRHQRRVSRCSTRPTRRSAPAVHLKTYDYPGLPEAIEAAAPKLGARPRSVIACGAGPVDGRKLKLTNAPWMMDGPETARRPASAQGLLLNDFEAQALSLPTIPEGWARPIGPLPFGAGPAGDSRPRHRARHRRAGRGGRAVHRRSLRGLPHRFRPGRRRRNSRSGRISSAFTAA